MPGVQRRTCQLAIVLTIATTAFASSSDAGAARARTEKARSLFLDACTACHTLDRVRVQHLTAKEWRGVIAGMLAEGVPLTDEEMDLLVEYLAANFGPDNKNN